jgi:hypothetical protein
LHEILEQSRARSAVFDVITNRVPVSIEADTLWPGTTSAHRGMKGAIARTRHA